MWLETALQAMREAKRLEVRYDGWTRIVEVHAAGYNEQGAGLMMVWQVRGGSNSEPVGWKQMLVERMGSYKLIDEPSGAPRPGYNGANKGIAEVVAEL